MDRLIRTDQGTTLLELLIAIVLFTVVLLSATNLLTNFGNFSVDVAKSESLLMATALSAFEEMASTIAVANKVTIKGRTAAMDYPSTPFPDECANYSCIQMRVDRLIPVNGTVPAHFTPSLVVDDSVYTYWLDQLWNLKRMGRSGDGTGKIIAADIFSLAFNKINDRVQIILEAQTASGTTGGVKKEHLETVVSMRSRAANTV